MNHENFEDSGVSGDCDVGSVDNSMDTASGSPIDSGNSAELTPVGVEKLYKAHPNLKPGVQVEEIPGLSEYRARELGLLKSETDYQHEVDKQIAEAESYDHSAALSESTGDLLSDINSSLASLQVLGQAMNKSYGKFMGLGMETEAEFMVSVQANVHFEALNKLLQEAKARAILLNVELSLL